MEQQIAKIYTKNETAFTSNGLGTFPILKGTESKKEGIGEWKIDVDLPLEARALVFPGEIIAVQGKTPKYTSNNRDGAQYFRIDEVKKTRGRLNVQGHHILYDNAYSVFKITSEGTASQQTAGQIIRDALRNTNGDRPTLLTVSNETTDTTKYTNEPLEVGAHTGMDLLKHAYEICGEAVNISVDGLNAYITDRDKTAKKLTYGKEIVEFKLTDSADESYDRIYPFDENGLTIDEGYIDSSGAATYGVRRSAIVTFTLGSEITDESTRKQLLYQEAQAAVEAASTSRQRYELTIADSVILEVGDYVEIWDPLTVNTNDGEVQAMVPMVVTACEFDICKQAMKSVTFGNLGSTVSRAQKGSVDKVLTEEGITADSSSDSGGGGGGGGGEWNPPDTAWIGTKYASGYSYWLEGEPDMGIYIHAADSTPNHPKMRIGPDTSVFGIYINDYHDNNSRDITTKVGSSYTKVELNKVTLRGANTTITIGPDNAVKITASGGLWVNGTQIA